MVGLDSFAGDAPIWFLILAGGVLADRGDRRKTVLVYQGIQLACPVILVGLLVSGKVTVPALLTVFVSGLLCAPIVTFAPVLIRDGLHRGTGSFSGALSAYGVGGLVGAGVVLLLSNNRRRQVVSSLAALGVGVVVVIAALAPNLPVVLVAFALVGAGMVTSNASANTILQSAIEARLRGRFSSIYTLALRGSMALGSIATGALVSHSNVRTGLLVDGVVAIGAHLLLIASIRRALRAQHWAA